MCKRDLCNLRAYLHGIKVDQLDQMPTVKVGRVDEKMKNRFY